MSVTYNRRNNHPNLQALVCAAMLDETLCARLLNGDRQRLIADFELTQDEREAVLAIEADTLETFAQKLLHWIRHNDEVRLRA